MNDTEDLRDAMHTTPGFEPKPLDLALVMHAGGRLRRRRRATIGAASGLAVLALLVGGAQLARPWNSPAAVGQQGRQAQQDPPAHQGQQAAGTSTVPASPETEPEPEPGRPSGAAVDTGMTADGLARMVWMRKIQQPSLPDVEIGMATGRRAGDGTLITDVVSNEVEGSDRSPGFHALEMAMELDSGPTPAFGYYVGDAAKIGVTVGGRTVLARQATWSADRSVVLFWFDVDQVGPTSRVGKAVAYDDDGRRLPAGNNTFAVG